MKKIKSDIGRGRFIRKDILRSDAGALMLETILVIMLTSLLAALFARVFVTAITMFSDHNMRKTSHGDMKRTSDMISNDIRGWTQWYQMPAEHELTFETTTLGENDVGRSYFFNLRVGYLLDDDQMFYRRNDEGDWENLYPLISECIVPDESGFSTWSAGGTTRINITVIVSIRDKPMRLKITLFPRIQGA